MKKKFVILFSICLACALSGSDSVPRSIRIEGKPVKVSRLEIVVEKKIPLVNFAAEELKEFIALASGLKPVLVEKPSGNALALILGDCPLARSAGLRTELLPEEGFRILRKGENVFIFGCDDPNQSPEGNSWMQLYRRSTLTGVYDFLERFAGIRFYFPGPHGTIVPKRDGFFLPPVIDITDRPDMDYRVNYMQPAKGYGFPGKGKVNCFTLEVIRTRMHEAGIPYGHGLAQLHYIDRFAQTHPEYFALMSDGRRYSDKNAEHSGQLCFNSGIREEVFQDAKAYLTGRPASERGLQHWSPMAASRRKYFSVMPQDWFYWCCCNSCARIAPGGRGAIYSDPKAQKAVNEFIWKFTAEMADRLNRAGIKGIITQMAYLPYKDVPDCKLPENVDVQVAVHAFGQRNRWKEDEKTLKSWSGKLGHRVTVWTYPGKHGAKAEMKGIPALMHHEFGEYFRYFSPYVRGAFNEAETDYELFNYLNFYLFGRIAWNTSLDPEALLTEHYELMFGPAAETMRTIYDELENIWCHRILGHTVDTSLGPVSKLPSTVEVWTHIFNREKLNWFNRQFDLAERSARGPELERVKFIRHELFGPVLAEAEKFAAQQKLVNEWHVNVPGKVFLRPNEETAMPFPAVVSLDQTPADLIFRFDVADPRTSELPAKHRDRDSAVHEDAAAELFLNPSGDRKHYYHIAVNLNGALYDASCTVNEPERREWNSGARVRAERKPSGWSVTVTVPKQALGEFPKEGFPVNFAVSRALFRNQRDYFQWSPAPGKSFHEIARWGIMNLVPKADPNLLSASGFAEVQPGDWNSTGTWSVWEPWGIWRSGGFKGGQEVSVVSDYFIIGGKSLHLVNRAGLVISAGQFYELEPEKHYRLTYSVRTRLKGEGGVAAIVVFGDPARKYLQKPVPMISGNNDWLNVCLEFTTPPGTGTTETRTSVSVGIYHAEGEALLDNIRLVRVK